MENQNRKISYIAIANYELSIGGIRYEKSLGLNVYYTHSINKIDWFVWEDCRESLLHWIYNREKTPNFRIINIKIY